MKKSLRKVIVTLSAVAALSLAMGATAMADVTTSEIQDGKATVTYTTQATAGEQVTVLLLKPDADATDGIAANEIAYIDQKAAGTDGNVEFVMPITGVAEGQKYALMSGSETATEVVNNEANFEADTPVITYGDVTGERVIDGDDALEVLYYFVGMDSIIDTDAEKAAANVTAPTNGDTDIDGDDALEIMYYFVGMDNVIDVSWGPEE